MGPSRESRIASLVCAPSFTEGYPLTRAALFCELTQHVKMPDSSGLVHVKLPRAVDGANFIFGKLLKTKYSGCIFKTTYALNAAYVPVALVMVPAVLLAAFQGFLLDNAQYLPAIESQCSKFLDVAYNFLSITVTEWPAYADWASVMTESTLCVVRGSAELNKVETAFPTICEEYGLGMQSDTLRLILIARDIDSLDEFFHGIASQLLPPPVAQGVVQPEGADYMVVATGPLVQTPSGVPGVFNNMAVRAQGIATPPGNLHMCAFVSVPTSVVVQQLTKLVRATSSTKLQLDLYSAVGRDVVLQFLRSIRVIPLVELSEYLLSGSPLPVRLVRDEALRDHDTRMYDIAGYHSEDCAPWMRNQPFFCSVLLLNDTASVSDMVAELYVSFATVARERATLPAGTTTRPSSQSPEFDRQQPLHSAVRPPSQAGSISSLDEIDEELPHTAVPLDRTAGLVSIVIVLADAGRILSDPRVRDEVRSYGGRMDSNLIMCEANHDLLMGAVIGDTLHHAQSGETVSYIALLQDASEKLASLTSNLMQRLVGGTIPLQYELVEQLHTLHTRSGERTIICMLELHNPGHCTNLWTWTTSPAALFEGSQMSSREARRVIVKDVANKINARWQLPVRPLSVRSDGYGATIRPPMESLQEIRIAIVPIDTTGRILLNTHCTGQYGLVASAVHLDIGPLSSTQWVQSSDDRFTIHDMTSAGLSRLLTLVASGDNFQCENTCVQVIPSYSQQFEPPVLRVVKYTDPPNTPILFVATAVPHERPDLCATNTASWSAEWGAPDTLQRWITPIASYISRALLDHTHQQQRATPTSMNTLPHGYTEPTGWLPLGSEQAKQLDVTEAPRTLGATATADGAGPMCKAMQPVAAKIFDKLPPFTPSAASLTPQSVAAAARWVVDSIMQHGTGMQMLEYGEGANLYLLTQFVAVVTKGTNPAVSQYAQQLISQSHTITVPQLTIKLFDEFVGRRGNSHVGRAWPDAYAVFIKLVESFKCTEVRHLLREISRFFIMLHEMMPNLYTCCVPPDNKATGALRDIVTKLPMFGPTYIHMLSTMSLLGTPAQTMSYLMVEICTAHRSFESAPNGGLAIHHVADASLSNVNVLNVGRGYIHDDHIYETQAFLTNEDGEYSGDLIATIQGEKDFPLFAIGSATDTSSVLSSMEAPSLVKQRDHFCNLCNLANEDKARATTQLSTCAECFGIGHDAEQCVPRDMWFKIRGKVVRCYNCIGLGHVFQNRSGEQVCPSGISEDATMIRVRDSLRQQVRLENKFPVTHDEAKNVHRRAIGRANNGFANSG